MKTKQCTRCKEFKDVSLFCKKSQNKDGLHIYCKNCNSEIHKRERLKKLSKPKILVVEKKCSTCHLLKPISEFGNRKESLDGFSIYCNQCKLEYDQNYRKNNTSFVEKQQQYYQLNREAIIQKVKFQKYRRLKHDKSFRLKCVISSRINKLMKKIRNNKDNDSILKFLPYNMSDLISHLESLFSENMSWDNYGQKGWHIDHIKPVSSFNIQSIGDDEFIACWSLNNLQPLWWYDNLKKSNKIY